MKMVKVKVLKPLHEQGKKTIPVGKEIDMPEDKATILSKPNVAAVELVKETK